MKRPNMETAGHRVTKVISISTDQIGGIAGAGLIGEFSGKLLWLVVGLHAIISILLGRIWLVNAKTVGRDNNANE